MHPSGGSFFCTIRGFFIVEVLYPGVTTPPDTPAIKEGSDGIYGLNCFFPRQAVLAQQLQQLYLRYGTHLQPSS